MDDCFTRSHQTGARAAPAVAGGTSGAGSSGRLLAFFAQQAYKGVQFSGKSGLCPLFDRLNTSSRLLWALHGPNLNLLGTREPGIYGSTGLPAIDADLAALCAQRGHRFEGFQSNHEGELIDRIQQASSRQVAFIVFNPAAFTHTSIALRDALAAVAVPFIEVHLSNIHAREAFRQRSFFSDLAAGVISGLGPIGYRLAMLAALEKIGDPASAGPSPGVAAIAVPPARGG